MPGVEPARGIAAVSAAAYLGFMAGPPVIGFLARVSSLTAALYVVVVFAVGAGGLGAPRRRSGLTAGLSDQRRAGAVRSARTVASPMAAPNFLASFSATLSRRV